MAGALLAAAAAGLGALLLGLSLLRAETPQPARLEALADEARALAAATEAEIGRRAGLLAALAASPALDRPTSDLRALDLHARATAGVMGAPVIVVDASLAQLANTDFGFGTPLPWLEDAAVALRALETGRLAVGAGAGQAGSEATGIAVPARREGRTVAVLLSRIEGAHLAALLDQAVPSGRAAALVDGGRVLAAAARLPEGATPDLDFAAQAARLAGPVQARADAASGLLAAAAPVAAVPGWRIIAASPLPPATAWGGALPVLLGAGILAVLAGLAAASALGRRPRRRLEEALREAEAARRVARASEAAALHGLSEARRLHDTIPVGLALVGQDLRFLSVNAKFASVAGLMAPDHLRRHPSDVMPPSIAAPVEEALREVMATGQPVIDLPLVAEAPGAVRNERHFLASCHPAFDGEQRITGVSVVLQDVTERVRAERARELLVRELNHRVKNTLATVQSIAVVTLRQAGPNPERLCADLGARLLALARAHDLLTAHAWEAADLAEVVRAALAPWLDSMPARIGAGGPEGVLMRPSQAQAVVLALHELATNAVKHGALSVPEGRVSLRWQVAPGGRTRMAWRESGGPPVSEPPADRRGFGTRLLERALASDLGAGAEVRLDFARTGLEATISFTTAAPLPAIEAGPEARAAGTAAEGTPAEGAAPAALVHAGPAVSRA